MTKCLLYNDLGTNRLTQLPLLCYQCVVFMVCCLPLRRNINISVVSLNESYNTVYELEKLPATTYVYVVSRRQSAVDKSADFRGVIKYIFHSNIPCYYVPLK